jgi:hypothetical protein
MTEKTPPIRAGVGTTPAAQSLLDARLYHAVVNLAPWRYRGATEHFLQWYEQIDGRPLVLTDPHPITLDGYPQALNELTAYIHRIDL